MYSAEICFTNSACTTTNVNRKQLLIVQKFLTTVKHSEQCEMQPKPIFQRKMRQNLIVTKTIYLKRNSHVEDNSKTISDSYLQINLQSPHQKQVPSA